MVSLPEFSLVQDDPMRFLFTHDCSPLLPGMAPFRRTDEMPHSGGTWQIVNREPLTVTPSINCTQCGTHGFITNGQWVNA